MASPSSYDFSRFDYLFDRQPTQPALPPVQPAPDYSYPKAGLAVAGGSAVGAVPKLGGMFVGGLARQIPEGFVEDMLAEGMTAQERQSLLAELQARQRGERVPEAAQRAMAVGPELTQRLREQLGTAAPQTPAQRLYEAGVGAGAEIGTLGALGGLGAGASLGEAGLGALSGFASQAGAELGASPALQAAFGLVPYFGRALFRKIPAAEQATLEGVRARSGLGTLDLAEAEPIARSALATDLQAAVKAERAATAAPIREAYDAWNKGLKGKSVMIPADNLRQLAENHRRIVAKIRQGSKAGDPALTALLETEAVEGGARSISQVIEEMAPLQRGSVPRWTSAQDLYEYRSALQAILNKQKKLVGKKELLLGPQIDDIDRFLQQTEGWPQLKAANEDWFNLKRRFDENPTVKKWFEQDINPEDVLVAIDTGTEAQHLLEALPVTQHARVREYIKDTITRMEPKEALKALRDKEHFKTLMGPEYAPFRAEMVQAVRDAPRLNRAVQAMDNFFGKKWVNGLLAVSGGIEGILTKEGFLAGMRTLAQNLTPGRQKRFERLMRDPAVQRALQVQALRLAEQEREKTPTASTEPQRAEGRRPVVNDERFRRFDYLFSR